MDTILETIQKNVPEKHVVVLTRDKHLIYIHNTKFPEVRLRYNLKARHLEKFMGKSSFIDDGWRRASRQYRFFSGFSTEDIICKEEKFDTVIKRTISMNRTCNNIASFLERLNDALVYENYDTQGIKTECKVKRKYDRYFPKVVLTQPLEFYSKNTIKFFKEFNIEVTYYVEKVFVENYEFWTKTVDKIYMSDMSNEDKKGAFETIIDDWDFKELVVRHGYDEMTLLKFIYEYLIPFENYRASNALSDLRDYYEMASKIGRSVKRYPKYLRSMHDIITSNYNAFKKDYDERLFSNLMKTELEHDGVTYCIRVPKNSKDICKEGTALNHCVGSYVDKILRGETYIFFLREKKTPDDSLVTLELKDGALTQAKGSYNRPVTDEERKYLESYCKLKGVGFRL